MAKRPTLTLPATEPVVVETPNYSYIPTPISTSAQSPKTRDEIAHRDAIRSQLAEVEAGVVEFVTEKTAEGFSMDDIFALYQLELPIVFSYHLDGTKLRARYGFQIVERAD
ncbi:hypothetical protein ASF70_13040 [Rhizobium sp. Leaf321]|uniref:hypothetical protein n=1 Tax=Rhizobium sp. Leaf321 TaxID=1736335 RepID=UPI000715C33A|nr:hypothetical protein [Rhizobium sp. Leaf321]KQQ72450.1 hypothetical protein ASF70_13040 [Rhizobium sp. Leaf321]